LKYAKFQDLVNKKKRRDKFSPLPLNTKIIDTAGYISKFSAPTPCLGGAFTKDSGQRNLVRRANKTIAIEGCFISCSSRMMKGVLPGLRPK
jgi:hypothetical protein